MNKYFSFIIFFTFSIILLSLDDEISEISLPELGDRVSGAVSSNEEKAIGEMFLKQAYSQAPLISDPILFEYTEHLIYSCLLYTSDAADDS